MHNESDKQLPISSSQRPAFNVAQEAMFRDAIELMNRTKVQYAISGAFALYRHTGIWREPKDLDLVMPATEVGRGLKLLAGERFRTEVVDPAWLAKAWRGCYFVDLITGMRNGALRVDDSWIKHASWSDILGIPARVLAVEELIASKIFVTCRERFDGADICHLIYGTQGRLDWCRLMNIIGEHWQLLFWHLVLYQYVYPACSGYVPEDVWDELLERFRIELEHPNQYIGFRGSLIDRRMFAIDVEEWGKRDLIDEYRARVDLIQAGVHKVAQ